MTYQEFRALFPKMEAVDTGVGIEALHMQVRPGCYVMVGDYGHLPSDQSELIDVALYLDDRGLGGHFPDSFTVVQSFAEAAEEIQQWIAQETAVAHG